MKKQLLDVFEQLKTVHTCGTDTINMAQALIALAQLIQQCEKDGDE